MEDLIALVHEVVFAYLSAIFVIKHAQKEKNLRLENFNSRVCVSECVSRERFARTRTRGRKLDSFFADCNMF